MKVKLSEVINRVKGLRDNGLEIKEAIKAAEKFYNKKGYTGSFVVKEDGEEIAMAELEFKELEAEEEDDAEEGTKSMIAQHSKAIADAVSKGFETGAKALIPAVPADKEAEQKGYFGELAEFTNDLVKLEKGVESSKMKAWRTKAAPSVSMGESSVEAGGALIPPGFLPLIKQYENLAGPDLLSECTNIPVTGNNMSFPTNEETDWGQGVQAYWQAELQAMNQVRPKMKDRQFLLNSLTAFAYVGDELLEDSPAASTFIAARIGKAIRWKTNEALINGSGSGQPLGVLNAGNLVVVDKQSGQAAGTFNQANMADMLAAHLNPDEATWFITPRMWANILKNASLPGGILPAQFNIGTGLSGKPYKTLAGLPVVVLRNCASLGKKGDIILADMKEYYAISKSIKMASSIHLAFDANATAFRAKFRVDGKPWATAPVVDAHDATFTQSPFVTLAARS